MTGQLPPPPLPAFELPRGVDYIGAPSPYYSQSPPRAERDGFLTFDFEAAAAQTEASRTAESFATMFHSTPPANSIEKIATATAAPTTTTTRDASDVAAATSPTKKIFQSYFDFYETKGVCNAQIPRTPSSSEHTRNSNRKEAHHSDRCTDATIASAMLPPMSFETSGPNLCRHCGHEFGEFQFAQRLMHQRVCESNPTSLQQCVYCSLQFRSTWENLAIELVADHEDLCTHNPNNLCQWCGSSFTAGPANPAIPHGRRVLEMRVRLSKHSQVCGNRPTNETVCSWCWTRVRATTTRSAQEMLEAHHILCVESPRNSCRFCRLRFTGTLHPIENTPLFKRRRHESICPLRYITRDRVAAASGETVHQSMWENTDVSSADVLFDCAKQAVRPEEVDRRAAQVIKALDLQLQTLTVDKQRGFLRKAQKSWHPDRVPPENEKLANMVFCQVQKRWEAYRHR